MWRRKKCRVGLALSGGGARGLAYIGVFRALADAGIKIDFVSGTSVGALAAVIYASKCDLDRVEEYAKRLTTRDIMTRKMLVMPDDTAKLQKIIRDLVDVENLEDLSIPCEIVTCDIKTAQEVSFRSGDISKIVAGSCSMPGFFNPVVYEDYHLMDGGLINNIPANKCRNYPCDVVIVIDINSTRGSGTDSLKTLECVKVAMRILMKNNSKDGYKNADIVVKPDLKRFSSTKLENIHLMIEEGYRATMAAMPDIKMLIDRGPRKQPKVSFFHKTK